MNLYLRAIQLCNFLLIEIMTVESGDLIWWRWGKNASISMCLVDASLLFDKKLEFDKCQKAGMYRDRN